MRFQILILVTALLSGIGFFSATQAATCGDLFASDSSGAVPQTSATTLQHLEMFIHGMLRRAKFESGSDRGTEIEYYYRGSRFMIRQSTRPFESSIGVATIPLPKSAIVSQTSVQTTDVPSTRSQQVVVGKTIFDISKDAMLLAHVGKKTYRIAALSDEAHSLVSLEDPMPYGTKLYVLEYRPYNGTTSARATLREIALPLTLPQQEPAEQKNFDISRDVAGLRPLMMSYGRFLILGGSSLAIFDSQTQTAIRLQMDQDYQRSPVIALEKLSEGKIKVTRWIDPSVSHAQDRAIEFVIDLNQLEAPSRR